MDDSRFAPGGSCPARCTPNRFSTKSPRSYWLDRPPLLRFGGTLRDQILDVVVDLELE